MMTLISNAWYEYERSYCHEAYFTISSGHDINDTDWVVKMCRFLMFDANEHSTEMLQTILHESCSEFKQELQSSWLCNFESPKHLLFSLEVVEKDGTFL